MQIPELLTQRKFVSAACHAHSDLDSVALYAAQVCHANLPRPHKRPQAAQICGAYNFHARKKILTEMY